MIDKDKVYYLLFYVTKAEFRLNYVYGCYVIASE